MKKKVGLFEAKTRFSEICEGVARSKQPVIVTRRGKPLVRILPAEDEPPSIIERRRAYMKKYGKIEQEDDVDFEPDRSRDISDFDLDGA